jgi:hypothetical protein
MVGAALKGRNCARLGYRRVGEFTTPDETVVIGTYWRDPR